MQMGALKMEARVGRVGCRWTGVTGWCIVSGYAVTRARITSSLTYLLNRDLRRITSTESRNDALMAINGRTATNSSEAVEWLKWDRYTNASFSCRFIGVYV